MSRFGLELPFELPLALIYLLFVNSIRRSSKHREIILKVFKLLVHQLSKCAESIPKGAK